MFKNKFFAIDIDGTITEDETGKINLEALEYLRYLELLGHKVIFVSGRSSVEGYLLSVFAGLTRVAIGENGGAITLGPQHHKLLGDMEQCLSAYRTLKRKMPELKEKNVFPRMTEVVLQRPIDLDTAREIINKEKCPVILSDSMFAVHINSNWINKAIGFGQVRKMFGISKEDVISIGDSETDIPLFKDCGMSVALGNSSNVVRENASLAVKGHAGDGVIEALDKIIGEKTV